MKNLKQGFM